MKYEEEKRRDAILNKFRGNKSFSMDEQIHAKDFYESIDSDYFVIENSLNFLLADEVLIRYMHQIDSTKTGGYIEMIKLSPKGFFMISNLKKHGYEIKAKNENREKSTNIIIQLATLLIAALSLLASLYQIYK